MRIKVRDGLEVEHKDGHLTTMLVGGARVYLTREERDSLVNALTWQPNTRPGEIGDEDG